MEENSKISTVLSSNEIPQFTPEAAAFLLKAAKWGKFLAILGFIVTGLLIVAGILMNFVLNTVTDEAIPLNLPFSPVVLSFIYILIAAIYIIPVISLNSFCNNAIKAINQSNTEKLTTSFRSLKNLFVFIGVSTTVILVLYTIVLITVGLAAFVSL